MPWSLPDLEVGAIIPNAVRPETKNHALVRIPQGGCRVFATDGKVGAGGTALAEVTEMSIAAVAKAQWFSALQ
jgi:hypothetical protein